MNLDDAQKQKVAAWIAEGLKPSEIQNRLASEFGLRLTFLEAKLLLSELQLTPKDREPAKPIELLAVTPADVPPAPADPSPLAPPSGAPAGGGVSLSVDQIARPGAMVSGKVTFSDGKNAEWYLDQTGRLGLAGPEKGYKPPQADIAEFQAQLQDELAKMGF